MIRFASRSWKNDPMAFIKEKLEMKEDKTR
jgi:hypothetical protein